MPQNQGASVADLQRQLKQYEAVFAMMQGGGQGGGSGLPGLPGGNFLNLDPKDTASRVEALQAIPTRAPRGTSAQEMGFAPSGVQFTGGSPHEQDFTAKRIQNAIFLLNQLQKGGFFEMLKNRGGSQGSTPATNSVQTGQAPYGGPLDLLKGLR